MAIKNVAIIGANGSLGPAVLNRLIQAGTFHVTVLTRASSKSDYPKTARVYRVADSMSKDELVSALKGQDALVITFAGYNTEDAIKLADAALEAGVQRIIPPDFGSCDSDNPEALKMIPLYGEKNKVKDYLKSVQDRGSLSWTSIVCGHFFDWSLANGYYKFFADKKEAMILDEGDTKSSATTLDTIGLAVVKVLQNEEATKNKKLFIQSFCISQNELLKACERVTGQAWNVKHVDSNEFLKEEKKKMDQGDKEARENVILVQGLRDTNWEKEPDFANSLLGLETENLDEVVRKVIG